jgi:hypothetical protein
VTDQISGANDPVAYAQFISQSLIRPINPSAPALRAASETEADMLGDRWFWADDNAKILTFLARRQLFPGFAQDVLQLQRFLADLCAGQFIMRRVGEPRLDKVRAEGDAGEFVMTFLRLTYQLKLGLVHAGIRYHDGRSGQHLTLTGNYINFTHKGTRYAIDMEEAISSFEVIEKNDSISLVHISTIQFRPGWNSIKMGEIRYQYTFYKASAKIDVSVDLQIEDGIDVKDVDLTLAFDNLSHGVNNVNYNVLKGCRPDGSVIDINQPPPAHGLVETGPLSYVIAHQTAELAGFALAVHAVLHDSAAVKGIRVFRLPNSQLHWVVIEHRFSGSHVGTKLGFTATVWLSGGGFYDMVPDYATFLRRLAAEEPSQPLDISISYDYGAELEAFALCYKVGKQLEGIVDLPVGWADSNRVLFDRYFEVYKKRFLEPERQGIASAYLRPTCLVALGLCDLLESTGDENYLLELRYIMEEVVAFARHQKDIAGTPCVVFTMGRVINSNPFVDCHSAAILALAKSYKYIRDEKFLRLIDLALGAYSIRTASIDLGINRKQDVIGIDFQHQNQTHHFIDAFWNFCSALALRAITQLKQNNISELRQLYEKHEVRLEIIEALIRMQFARSTTVRDGSIEVRTSALSAESNSETQPWVALSLFPDID